MDPHENAIVRQAEHFQEAIGYGLPSDIVDDLQTFAQDASVDDFYVDNVDIKFWFEVLEKDGWRPKARAAVDRWVMVSRNKI